MLKLELALFCWVHTWDHMVVEFWALLELWFLGRA